jgi:hypothetical protein
MNQEQEQEPVPIEPGHAMSCEKYRKPVEEQKQK